MTIDQESRGIPGRSFTGWRSALRQPLPWIAVWAMYSLLALGWFGYRDALSGFMCIASK